MLFVIMVLTLTSITYISRSDAELACGNNMIVRAKMDNLAQSGLSQALGLLKNPWDVEDPSQKYWTGQGNMQLNDTTDDYYSVGVTKSTTGNTYRCAYDVNSTAYRMNNGSVIAQSSIKGTLRFDPAIAVWFGSYANISEGIVVNGDLYYDAGINYGYINGDVFTRDSYIHNFGTIIGQVSHSLTEPPVASADIDYLDFQNSYKFNDGSTYSATTITPGTYSNQTWTYSSLNPAGIFYCPGDLTLDGNIDIDGSLIVEGNLNINGSTNHIDSVKNFPALIANDSINIYANGGLTANGLVQVKNFIIFDFAATNVNVKINGALFMHFGDISGFGSSKGSFVVNADPIEAAIQIWPALSGSPQKWLASAGAYYKEISK